MSHGQSPSNSYTCEEHDIVCQDIHSHLISASLLRTNCARIDNTPTILTNIHEQHNTFIIWNDGGIFYFIRNSIEQKDLKQLNNQICTQEDTCRCLVHWMNDGTLSIHEVPLCIDRWLGGVHRKPSLFAGFYFLVYFYISTFLALHE